MLIASCSCGSNALALGRNRRHPQPLQLAEELAPHHLDALEQRLGIGGLASGIDRAIEVVDDVEHFGEDLTPGALDVLRDLPPQPQARFVELRRRLPVLAEILLDLPILLGDGLLQLLDVGRLERRRRRPIGGGGVRVAPTSGGRRP